MTQTQVRDRTSRKPSRSSRRQSPPAAAAVASARRRGRRRMISTALTRKVAASIANAAPAPAPSTSTVASAGPTNSATLSAIVVSAFACWISASGTVWGTRPVAAGRKNASALPNTASIATTCQISTSPAMIRSASPPWSAKRTRSVATTTRWRGRRSAQTPPMSTKPTRGSAWAARTNPRSVALPVRSVTKRARATVTIRSPRTLRVVAAHSRRKSRWRRTELRAGASPVRPRRRRSGCGRSLARRHGSRPRAAPGSRTSPSPGSR